MESDSYALKTGLFLLLAGILAAGTFVVFGDRAPPGLPYLVHTRESVAGLAVESRVYYKGVEVGRVREIGFRDGNFDEVRLLIEVDASVPLGENTFAQLALRGITGEYDLVLDNDGQVGPRLARQRDGPPPEIPMKSPYILRLGESVERALSEIEELAANVRKLTESQNRERLEEILDLTAAALERFVDLEDRVSTVVDGLPATIDSLSPAVERFAEAMVEVRGAARALTDRTDGLDPLIATMTEATESLDRLLDAMQGETLANVDQTLQSLRVALRQLTELAEALQRDPQSILFGPPPQRLGPGENEGGP